MQLQEYGSLFIGNDIYTSKNRFYIELVCEA